MIVFNFDVLAYPGDELGARVPDPDGLKLFRMFHAQTRGTVAIVYKGDLYDPTKKKIFEEWLKRENVKASYYEAIGSDTALQEHNVHKLSTMFGRADWYVDDDPELCTRLYSKGVRCFIYANPQIIRPEWHETRSARPWDALVAEMDRQAEMLSARAWGEMEGSDED
jgi:hypothetical protein